MSTRISRASPRRILKDHSGNRRLASPAWGGGDLSPGSATRSVHGGLPAAPVAPWRLHRRGAV